MRDALAPLAFTRHYFTAIVGPRGNSPGGPTVCLRDLRCAETDTSLAEHVWARLPCPDPGPVLCINRRIRFRAKVMPYKRAAGGGEDYHLTGLWHVERVAEGGRV